LPERRKLRPCLLKLWPERLCKFLVAHPFDPGGEGLEQLERHLFRRVIGRVGWAWLEIGLGVGRAVLPSVNDLLGYAGEIAGDGFSEAAAERPFGAALLKRRRAVAIEEIFERGQALKRHALADKARLLRDALVLLGEHLADLTGAEALGVRPIEDALEAMLLRHRVEADRLDHAPGFDRGGERILRILQRRG